MKFLLAISLVLLVNQLFAQQGRHELPIDTIPIGGKEQEIKMTRLEGYDELLNQLTGVRDSVAAEIDRHKSDSIANDNSAGSVDRAGTLPEYKARLDKLIREMGKKEHDENLMKEGYVLLKEVRRELATPAKVE